MNSAFIGSLMDLAAKDTRVLYLTADSGEGGLDKLFRMNFGDRSFDFGIAEQNMVSAAAGLACTGKIPFVFTAAPFLLYRAFEFIRNDICLQNLNVKLIGSGSGLSVGSLGPTHHSTEDIAVLRAIPNLTILSPATPKQVTECMKLAYRHVGPVYIRIGMNKEPEFYGEQYEMALSRNEVVRHGTHAVLYVTGSILEEAMISAERLSEDGIELEVVNVATIKPFDTQSVIESAGRFDEIFTLEEHSVIGGLTSIIAEAIAINGLDARLFPIGLDDSFARGYGTNKAVRKINMLDGENVCQRIREVLLHE